MNLVYKYKLICSQTYKIALLSTLFLAISFICTVRNINAQLDPTFGTNGVSQTDISLNDIPRETFILPDGKILVVSQNVDAQNNTKYHFIRYNSNGTLDLSYGTNGIKEISIPFIFNTLRRVNNFVRQPDGKILLLTTDNAAGLIIRYNEDGTIDQSFGDNGINRPDLTSPSIDNLVDATILPDGKILILGYVDGVNAPDQIFFIRYLPNGDLDTSFNGKGFILHSSETFVRAAHMAMQSDGKILAIVIGASFYVRRYNADGTPDNSFNTINNTQSSYLKGNVIVLPDDKILMAYQANKPKSLERTSLDIVVNKHNANGTLDNNFGNLGETSVDVTTTFDDRPFSMAVQNDGQILIGANIDVQPNRTKISGGMFSLIKFSSDGNINGKSLLTESSANSYGRINILPDGKVLSLFQKSQGAGGDLILARTTGVPFETYLFKGVPFDYDYSIGPFLIQYNGVSEPSVFRPSERKWYMHPNNSNFTFGLPDDIPVPSDYIKTLGTDIAVFRPSNGTWYIAKSSTNPGQNFIAVQWGQDGDIPTPADFDNDSKSDIAVFRPSNGVWYIRNSDDNSISFINWGINGDKPVTGDYDGDGKADIAVWRPSDRIWYILRSSDGQASYTQFGLSEDIPVQEDYDGDGKTDIAVWRPSTRVWYILRSSDGGFSAVQWGLSDDYVVPADYDGDKKTDIAVYRPSESRWYVFQSSNNALGIFNWGVSTDIIPQRRQ